MARPSGRNIRQMVLDETRLAVQTGGVNGFSYGDLAQRIGIKAPSIHHHFRRKEDLVAETADAYREHFDERIGAIDADGTIARLTAYGELFLSPADDGLLCFCGAAAAGWDDLSAEARVSIRSFFDAQLAWVGATMADGQRAGELAPDVDIDSASFAFVSALEGALLLARTNGRAVDLGVVVPTLLAQLTG